MFEKVEETPIVEEVTPKKEKVKKEKLKKEKKVKEKKPKKEGLSIFAFIVPFLLSVILIIGLYVLIGSKTESAVDTVKVMYAAKNIEKNTYIKAEDYPAYFKVVDTNIETIPKTAIQSADVLPKEGVYVRHELVENQMALITDLSDTDLVMGRYTGDIYKTSIACTTFKSSVSGRIRHGDIINIFAKDPETKELILLAKDIYVESAYDANGKECTSDVDVAVSFNVWAANEEDITGINLAITYGDIQIYTAEEE